MGFDFHNSVCTFYFSKKKFEAQGLERRTEVCDYYFYCDHSTPLDVCSQNGKTVLIFGDCVDVNTGKDSGLAEHIVNTISDIDDLVEYEKNLGGSYVILYLEGENIYTLCDATSTLPVFYLHTSDSFVCASNYSFFVNEYKFKADPELLQIRKASLAGAAFPFNITVYAEIKQLLPNHYLHWTKGTASIQRFVNISGKLSKISAIEAANKTLPMITTLTRFYGRKYSLCCPLTGGRDSRVVLGFLNNVHGSDSIPCYTIKHKPLTDSSDDLVIPPILTGKLGNRYKIIDGMETPENIREQFDLVFGKGIYSSRTLSLGYTIIQNFAGKVTSEGDIIGQVGKSSLFRDLPDSFATVTLFLGKLHNFSKFSRKYVKLWLKDIKNSTEQVNSYDLFCIEQRLGSWAAQKHLIYNMLGQKVVNIFNSRSIIYEWVKVDRRERMRASIQNELIRQIDSRMLSTPYTKSSKLERLFQRNWLLFYLGSILKFYNQKIRYFMGSK